jgi:hypothetical protein
MDRTTSADALLDALVAGFGPARVKGALTAAAPAQDARDRAEQVAPRKAGTLLMATEYWPLGGKAVF